MAGSRRAANQLALEAQLPAGMFQATAYRGQNIQLQPADRLVLVTDRVLEAGAPDPEFDEQRLTGLLLATAGLTPHQCRRSAADAAVLRPTDARRRDSCLPGLERTTTTTTTVPALRRDPRQRRRWSAPAAEPPHCLTAA